jgi:hypothetical protein
MPVMGNEKDEIGAIFGRFQTQFFPEPIDAVPSLDVGNSLAGFAWEYFFSSSRHDAKTQREKRRSLFSLPQEIRGKPKPAAASRRGRRTQLKLLFIFAYPSESLDPGKAGGRWNRVRKEGLLWERKLACFPMKAFPAAQVISLSLRLRGLCVRTVFLPHATAQRRNAKTWEFF